MVLFALGAVAHDRPAAVGTCVGSRGRRQDQLTVLVAVSDAAGGRTSKATTFQAKIKYSEEKPIANYEILDR